LHYYKLLIIFHKPFIIKKLEKNLCPPQNLLKTHRYWRLVEIIPGFCVWFTFFFLVFGAVYLPTFTADAIIAYTLIWVFRTYLFSHNLVKAYHYSKRAAKTEWTKLLSYLESPSRLKYAIEKGEFKFDPLILEVKKGPLEPVLMSRIDHLIESGQYLKPSDITHCITLFVCREPYEVIKTSLDSYVKSNFDLKKVIFVLAYEEFNTEIPAISKRLQAEYGHYFLDYLETCHPKNLPGEIPGRAANMNWSAKELKKYLEQHNIAFSRLLLSSFDADTVVSPELLNELTFRFCITENRDEVGYQPVLFYNNNIWDVPVFNRLVAISASFWQLSVSIRKDENKSFSSRAMSFQSVIDFGFWDPLVVGDDSRQFWTAFFVYKGRHYLENIYNPVYMDAVLGSSYLSTIKSQYKQLRRWAWGVCDFPFIAFNIVRIREIPFKRKVYEILHYLEGVYFWATGPVLLLFAGAVPGLINRDFSTTVLSHNLPIMMSSLLNMASIGIIVCLVITTQIIPFESQRKLGKKISLFLQWLLIPLVSIFLSAIPAIDAQTRLMLNMRLDFDSTQKARKKISLSSSQTLSTDRQ